MGLVVIFVSKFKKHWKHDIQAVKQIFTIINQVQNQSWFCTWLIIS